MSTALPEEQYRSASTEPTGHEKADQASIGELVADVSQGLSTLLRQEIALARAEAKQSVSQAGKAGGKFGGAALAGWMAVLFLSFALAWLLDQAMNTALAFAIVGVLWAIVGLVLMARAKREMKQMKGLPTTVRTVKEDVQWAKEQKS